jgi:formylglycine-generating enzyme required for sulfatase activity
MQSAPALGVGSLISESARILELVFQDPFYIVYSGELTSSGAKIGITEYYPADLVARAPSGDVLLRSLESQDLFNLGRDRFMAEARALSALRHPSLLRFDGVEPDHGTVLALHAAEEGQSVTSLIRSSKQPLPQEAMDAIVKPLVSALELMHLRNLIHANITPDTILLRPEPLLVRFGASRSFLAARMRKVNLAVTPGYSAPELHFSDEKAHGPLCDIFSLAAVLYFFVTGRHPINVIARGLGHTMPPAASLPTQMFRPQFLQAIDRGLELEPERRPQSMGAFGEMLLGIPEKKAPESTQPALQMTANLAESAQVHAARFAKPSVAPPKGASSPAAKAAPKPSASIPPAETEDEDDEFEDAQGSWGLGIGRLLVFAAVVVLLISAGLWLLEAQFRKQPEQSSQLDPGKAAPSLPAAPDRVASQDRPSQAGNRERSAMARPPEQNPVKPAPAEPDTRTAASPQPGPQTRPSEPPASYPPASENVAPPSNAANEKPQSQEASEEDSEKKESQAREPAGPAAGPAREAEVQEPETKKTEAAPSPEPSAKYSRDFAATEPAAPSKRTREATIEQPPAKKGDSGAMAPPLAPEKPAPENTSDKAAKLEPAPSPLTEASASSPAGYKFKDCDFCPPLVVVPNGEFNMGSNAHPHEKPAHKVRISRPFAIGQYEVTYAEWDRCVEAGACSYRPEHQGSPDEAIGNLSWDDAAAYLKWLSDKTGQVYRLPSEAEWEYAARAGSGKRFWWGDEALSGKANCSDCGSGTNGQPAAVGSYKPNAFGLYDTAGNIAEWVQDCWNESYLGAPADGSAWMKGNCSLHGLRGGSFGNKATYVRSSSRFRYDSDVRYEANGFRVLRELR